MRVFVAGLLGGVVFWLWAAVAHMALPIGEMGHQRPTSEDAVLATLKEQLPAEGVYIVPGLSGEQMSDPAAVAAYSAKAVANPQAFIVYQPQGEDGMQMGDNLGKHFATCVLAALVVGWVLSLLPAGFGRRVMVSTALGVFAWLTLSVPYWNWYRFPLDFVTGALLEQAIGWFVAGLAMAWWLGRGQR